MGGDARKKKIPLPAPTESESVITAPAPTELDTDVSQPGDDRSSYSLPEDGTPVTFKTRGHSANRSQTSLLIEYFEAGKSPGSESPGSRKPSVRVRVNSRRDDHIMISKPKSSSSHGRKVSGNRRSSNPQKASSSAAPRDLDGSAISGISVLSALSGDGEDGHSINSYASATEESNVSRNHPITVEIDRGGSSGAGASGSQQRHRPRRPTSPLIPTAAASSSRGYVTQSEISAIPADSFLDGSKSPRSTSPTRNIAAAMTAAAAGAAGAAGAAAVERHRVTSRSRASDRDRGSERDRKSSSKASSSRHRDSDRDRERERDKDYDRERRHRSSRSRASSLNPVDREEVASPTFTRSSRHRHAQTESGMSALDSSIMSSAPSHRSYDQYSVRSGASKTSSINNPKLLETVEDAIRRLILPELTALRREHSQRDRRSSNASTGTSASRDEYAGGDRRRSGASERVVSGSHTPRNREASAKQEPRDREGRHAVDDIATAPIDYASDTGDDTGPIPHDIDDTPKRSTDHLRNAALAGAAGAAIGGLAAAATAATADHSGSPSTARDQRRRRRAEARSKEAELAPSQQPHQSPPDLYLTGAHSAASRSFEDSGAVRHMEEPTDSELGLHASRLQHLDADAGYLQPPMPLMSEINSDVTRTSILSADSERPRSASEEIHETGTEEAALGLVAVPEPPITTTSSSSLQALGVQHANISHGDLRALPRKALPPNAQINEPVYDDDVSDEQDSIVEHDQQGYPEQYLHQDREEMYVEDYDGLEDYAGQTYDAYGHQIVPAPLKYVPYQPEHRGLSPIPSVSGYTEGGASEVHYRDGAMTATSTLSSPRKSPMLDRDMPGSPSSIPSNVVARDFDHDDHHDVHNDEHPRSLRDDLSALSSDIDYRPAPTQLTEMTEMTVMTDDGDVRAGEHAGANVGVMHTPIGVESAVASLVDGSMLDGSALTASSSVNGGHTSAQGSRGMDTLEEERSHGHATPSRQSVKSYEQSLREEASYHEQHEQPSHRELELEHEYLQGEAARSRSAHSYENQYQEQDHHGQHDEHLDHHEQSREINASPMTTGTNPSEFTGEYEIDNYGRKVRRPSPTASEAANITARAVGLAIQARAARNQKSYNSYEEQQEAEHESQRDIAEGSAHEWVPEGVQRNKSFKERTMNGGRRPEAATPTPTQSTENDDEYNQPQFGASGIPLLDDPIPEIGYGYGDDDLETNPSLVQGHDPRHEAAEHDWRDGNQTPTQDLHNRSIRSFDMAGAPAGLASPAEVNNSHGASQHSRQASQDQDEEWQRSSDERKRDTLITNPFEGASPIVNETLIRKSIPNAINGPNAAAAAAAAAVAAAAFGTAGPDYTTRSPIGGRYDEGYMSQGPGKSPDMAAPAKGKGIDYSDAMAGGYGAHGQEDPFYTVSQTRHFSGLSQGMATPLYDSATGAGIDRIENKDIVALMQHLMVRDAQRTARDTEILVTLVRAASEMRSSFENVKTMLANHEKGINNEFSKKLADSEDAIITEILDGTEKTVRTHLGGPRPLPGSAARSLHPSVSQGDMDDTPAKRQSIFRRALKSINAKGNNDLTRIEDMLNQLLTQVDVLKEQSAGGPLPGGIGGMSGTASGSGHRPSPYDGMIEAQMAYEQDRGYEPEGQAGTSTTSHASHSGHLSVASRGGPPQSRKFSDNRISTVPEANEDEMEYGHEGDGSRTPVLVQQQMDTLRATPERQLQQQSSENTPRTDKAKKHKSSGSASWFPKISRWSETTTSSVGRVFRSSRDSKKDQDELEYHSNASRSGSDLAAFDNYDANAGDKLHSGFSEADLHHGGEYMGSPPQHQQQNQEQYGSEMRSYHIPMDSTDILPPNPKTYMTPEDPKYRAHRDSLNLQHPQPRSGQPLKAALESRAEDFDSPMSPRSAEWAGSATSLHRFPGQNPNRYSDNSASNANAAAQWESAQAGSSTQLQAGPPRPPKEPLEQTPPRPAKLSKPSPLQYHTESGSYGNNLVATSYTGSPRLENRNLSSALGGGAPTRRPSGPRAMTPKSERSVRSYNDEEPLSERRRKRDTFGTVASQETETF